MVVRRLGAFCSTFLVPRPGSVSRRSPVQEYASDLANEQFTAGCVNPSWPRCSSLKWPHLAVGRSGSGCGGVGVTVAGAGVEGSEAEHADEPAHRGVRSDSLVGE